VRWETTTTDSARFRNVDAGQAQMMAGHLERGIVVNNDVASQLPPAVGTQRNCQKSRQCGTSPSTPPQSLPCSGFTIFGVIFAKHALTLLITCPSAFRVWGTRTRPEYAEQRINDHLSGNRRPVEGEARSRWTCLARVLCRHVHRPKQHQQKRVRQQALCVHDTLPASVAGRVEAGLSASALQATTSTLSASAARGRPSY
jgi:hypothetical protein